MRSLISACVLCWIRNSAPKQLLFLAQRRNHANKATISLRPLLSQTTTSSVAWVPDGQPPSFESAVESAGAKVQQLSSSDMGSPPEVTLKDGTKMTGKRGVVVATDQPAAAQLLGKRLDASPSRQGKGRGTCNVYFRYKFSSLLPERLEGRLPAKKWPGRAPDSLLRDADVPRM